MWFGPGAATLAFVIGLFLAVAPALPHDRTWARSLMALCGSVLLLRYLAWRVGATLEVDGLGMAGQRSGRALAPSSCSSSTTSSACS